MYRFLGDLCLEAKLVDDAGKAYKRSYELNPSDRFVINKLRELMKDEGVRI